MNLKTENIISFPTGKRAGNNRQLSESNLTTLVTKLLWNIPTCIIDYSNDSIEFFLDGYYFKLLSLTESITKLLSEEGNNFSSGSHEIYAAISVSNTDSSEILGQDDGGKYTGLGIFRDEAEAKNFGSENNGTNHYLKLGDFDLSTKEFSVNHTQSFVKKILSDKLPKVISGGTI